MKTTIVVEDVGKVTLDETMYLASGGEAVVYASNDIAYKIYHNPKQMIPVEKIQELSTIKNPNVLRPQHVIYASNGQPIGFTMDFVRNTNPICKLFTKAYKQKNGLSNEDITSFLEKMQDIIKDIHESKCLVVDLNELNVLASARNKHPYFIDVDSYQTARFRATAIMESIRDRMVKNNQWTELSDWYSFAILAFNMWIGIHPFKGRHPSYKMDDLDGRMKDCISVFDKDIALPPICNNFNIIPKSHLAWFRELFVNNKRMPPPEIGDFAPVLITAFNIISSNADFEVSLIETCPEPILDVFVFMGVNYFICKDKVFKGKAELPVDVKDCDKVLVCESKNAFPVVCKLKDNHLMVETDRGVSVGSIFANDIMYRNGHIYSVGNGKLMENTFIGLGQKTVLSSKVVGNVLDLSTKVFDGVIFQDLLGKQHITLPYEEGKCKIQHMKELDGYRVLDARSEKNYVVVMAERKGIYTRIVFCYNASFERYSVRKTENVGYEEVNMTVLPNGICVIALDSEMQLSKDENVKLIANPPFNSTTKVYNQNGIVRFFEEKNICSVRLKK